MEASVVALKIDKASVEGAPGESGVAVAAADFEGTVDSSETGASSDGAGGSFGETEEPAGPCVAANLGLAFALESFDVQYPLRYAHFHVREASLESVAWCPAYLAVLASWTRQGSWT